MGIIHKILETPRIREKIHDSINIKSVECECQINSPTDSPNTINGKNCHCEMIINVWNEDIEVKSHITQPINRIVIQSTREALP